MLMTESAELLTKQGTLQNLMPIMNKLVYFINSAKILTAKQKLMPIFCLYEKQNRKIKWNGLKQTDYVSDRVKRINISDNPKEKTKNSAS